MRERQINVSLAKRRKISLKWAYTTTSSYIDANVR